MIGSLRGVLLARWSDGEVLVEVAGIGYRVTTAPAASVALGDVGDEVFVHVHHHRREDAEVLYGFGTAEERMVFEALLGAHGVGPALAMAILSVHPPVGLQRVLADDDLAALCLVPGVGKKTAARLLVELKSRLDIPGLDSAALAGSDGAGGGGGVHDAHADVRDALAELGYATDEVSAVLRELPTDDDTSVLLRLALQKLATV
jgi:Holliday junction DNA helicase RuvA